MGKFNFKQKIVNAMITSNWKLQKKLYPEIDIIFENNNKSLTYEEADLSRIRLQHMMFLYKIYNKDIEEAYHYILDNLATLIKEIKPNPTLADILYIYSYLLYNGYLSFNNKFQFLIPEHELEIRQGLSIFTGEGVCRNVATLLNDLLSYFDIESFGIITYHDGGIDESLKLIEPFYEMCYKDHEEVEKELDNYLKQNNIDSTQRQTGNHFEVIAYSDGWYILDPSSLTISKITNKQTPFPLLETIRLWSLHSSGQHTLKFTTTIYNLLKNKSIKLCNCNKLVNIQKDCYKRCEQSKTKILEFRKQVNEDIDYLNSSLQTLPKY